MFLAVEAASELPRSRSTELALPSPEVALAPEPVVLLDGNHNLQKKLQKKLQKIQLVQLACGLPSKADQPAAD